MAEAKKTAATAKKATATKAAPKAAATKTVKKEAPAKTAAAKATTATATKLTGATYATGKRKDSIARVYLVPGKGNIVVNDTLVAKYFRRPVLQMIIAQPFNITKRETAYDAFTARAMFAASAFASSMVSWFQVMCWASVKNITCSVPVSPQKRMMSSMIRS